MSLSADATPSADSNPPPRKNLLLAPCDVAGIAFFRFVFGSVVLAHVALYFHGHLIEYYFGSAPHHLTYFGFEWVQPLELKGMKALYVVMGLSAAGVALGLLYRLSAIVLFLTFTWCFLAEAAQFQNHYYLMCLLAFLLALMPAHRSFSVDSILFPDKACGFLPNGWRLLLIFQISLPYVFGAIAKLDGDWLNGIPVGIWMEAKNDLPLIGPQLTERWMEWFICYAGLVIDLAAVPALLWKPTRIPMTCVLVAFHLCNSVLFPIDVFPWLSIFSLPLFYAPDWPRRWLRLPSPDPATYIPPASDGRLQLKYGLLALYIAWQTLLPLRHWLYPGNPSWTEEGQLFAWRMMLRTKGLFVRVYATDGRTGRTVEVPITYLLSPRQLAVFAESPYQILATSRFFAERAQEFGLQDVEIRTVAIVSLNGREPQLMLDPELDLLTIEPGIGPQPGILPLTQPRRTEPFDVPSDRWPEVAGVTLPTTE